MRQIFTWFLGILIAISLLAASCGEKQSNTGGKTLTVAGVGDAITLDPASISDNESWQIASQIFEQLVRYREGEWNQVEPSLATHWTISPSGVVWTFHLRKGVRFHDGSPLDADAVVFSLERQRDRTHPFHSPGFTYWESVFRNIQRVEKVDSHTVRIVIDRPFAPFLANLGLMAASIVSPTAMKRSGKNFTHHPVGTGPFRFIRWEQGKTITLTKNPHYWGGSPRLENLVYEVIPDARQRLMSLQSGSVDVAFGLALTDLQLVRLHPDLNLMRVTGNNVSFMAMNTQRAPFDDVRVRRAINHAINKETLINYAYQGLAIPAAGPIPPGMWSYNEKIPRYKYDPKQARALLQDAGYDLSRRPTLMVMSTPRPYLPEPVLVARMIARDLAKVGITVKLVIRPFSEHLRATQKGEHDLCIAGWTGDIADPDNFLYLLLDRDNARLGAARNLAMFSNDALHEILISARAEQMRSKRESYYMRAQEIVADQAPWVPLAHADLFVATRRKVRNIWIDPSTISYFHQGTK